MCYDSSCIKQSVGGSMKVMIVEDETMVSMLVEDMLIDAGHTPVGPAACVADALALIDTETFDAALLDINLGGVETAFPVADRLDELGIPYALVSGYDPAGIDARYSHVP
ncbi:MAG: response regulator, partial [Oxalobacteraceae bacterium]